MINADHLLDLADGESRAPLAGAPRQANLRRAISTAYYATFHELLGTAAQTFVAAAHWKSQVLFYRALDHGKCRDRCKKLGQNPLPNEEQSFFERACFPAGLRQFAIQFVRLQELRHEADYNPDTKFTIPDARDAVASARLAVGNLRNAGREDLIPFMGYVLLGLRR
jgi:hypothetical protein